MHGTSENAKLSLNVAQDECVSDSGTSGKCGSYVLRLPETTNEPPLDVIRSIFFD